MDFFVHKDEKQVEVTLRLDDVKGFILSIERNRRGDVEVTVRKTVNGCPGVRKPEFRKVYRK
jgi:hypothetical protein